MKRRAKNLSYFCFLWLVIPITGHAQQDTVTVMSYNIYHGENPYASGQSTVQDIANFISDVQPDFVSLQEVDSMTTRLAELNNGRSFDLADSLSKLTSMTGYFGKALDFGGGGYGVAILSQQSLELQEIMLPNPKDGEPRTLLFGESRLDSGKSLVFAATHLDHQYQKNRLAQVKALNERISSIGKPVILAGDFNFIPGTQEYAKMNSEWADVALQQDQDADFTYPTEDPEKRIDYIWLSRDTDWQVLEVDVPKISYSDHLPVVTKVIVK